MHSAMLMTAVWCVGISLGLVLLCSYQPQPCARPLAAPVWPSSLERSSDCDFEMLVFLNPHCPCSLATIRELSGIVSAQPDSVTVRVVLWQPKHADSDWQSSRLLAATQKIPDVRVHLDIEGRVSEELSIQSSGHVILFGKDRQAQFIGAITIFQGQTNHGRQAVEAILAGSHLVSIHPLPAFGCCIREERAISKVSDPLNLSSETI